MKSNEWHAWRSKGIGGSDISAICGLNKYRSPLQVYLEKIVQAEKFEGNEHTRRGNLLEQAVSNWFAEETGFEVYPATTGVHIALDIFRGTPDFFYRDSDGNLCILECKTTLKKMDGEPSPEWYCQLQWYLNIFGMESGSICWLESGFKFYYETYSINREFIAELEKKALEFWNNHVVAGVPPEPQTAEDLEILFPIEVKGKSVEAVNLVADLVMEYKTVSAELKVIEERKELLSEQIKLSISDAESLVFGGEILATYKAPKESVILDSKKLLAEMPEVYNLYTKPRANSRVLRVK